MVDTPTVTPEQQAVNEEVQKLGLKDEVVQETDTVETPPPAAPPATTPTTPPPPATPPATPPAAPSDAQRELDGLRERVEREKTRADETRRTLDAKEMEIQRLRTALGVPATTTPPDPQEAQGVAWMRAKLKDILPELIAELPEEVLDKHKSFQKRDMGLYFTREAMDQAAFLNDFTTEQRKVVKTHVLPILQQQRRLGGNKDTYEKLYEDYAKGVKAQAELLGLSATPPPSPPTPAAPNVSVPPSLSGVTGGPASVPSQPETLSVQDAKLLGLA
jgi:hypothetical protein